MTSDSVSGATSRTLSDTDSLRPGGAGPRISTVGRAGAFKDRPLWRRLQTIHHEIKEGRHPNTSSLAAELSVSTKTVQRDIDYLRDELEAPIEFRRDPCAGLTTMKVVSVAIAQIPTMRILYCVNRLEC